MKLTTLVLLFISLTVLCSAQYNKYGSRFISNYELNADSAVNIQSFHIHKDSRGILFISQVESLVEYDGTSMKYHREFNSVLATNTDPNDGTLYLSLGNDFGYIDYDMYGNSHFHSLKGLLQDDSFYLDDCIAFKGDTVLFFGQSIIISYCKSTQTVQKWKGNYGRPLLFENEVYSKNQDHIYTITPDTIRHFSDYKKDPPLLDIKRINNRQKLFSICDRLLLFNDNDTTYSFVSLGDFTDNLGATGQLDKIAVLNDNLFAIATRGATETAAVAFFDSLFQSTDYLGAYSGLDSKHCTHIEADTANGKLWTAHSVFSSINIQSPIRYFHDSHNIKGLISSMCKSGNNLIIGSTYGVSYRSMDANKFYSIKNLPSGDYGNVYSTCNYISPYTHKEENIINTDGGLFYMKNGTGHCMAQLNFNNITHNPNDPRTFYGLTHNDIIILTLLPNMTLEKRTVIELDSEIDFEKGIFSADGMLWANTYGDIIVRFNPRTKEWKTFDLPIIYKYFLFEGQFAYISTENELYVFNPDKDDFVKNESISFEIDKYVNLIHPYGPGYFVALNDAIGFCVKNENNNKYDFIPIPSYQLCDKSIIDVLTDEADSTIYFYSSKNIYCYRTDTQFNKLRKDVRAYKEYNYNALIRKVSTLDGDIFNGTFIDENGHVSLKQCEKYILSIPYNSASISFGYTATCYDMEEKTQFSFYLDGYSDEWSEWSSDRSTKFTNLWEGKYTFKVKAKNIYGTESSISEYSFIVEPPFYRSIWAYLLYAILTVIIIRFIVKLYIKRLKRENEYLERMVDERTKIIRKRDEEILDNINYASYIQHAALTPEEKISVIFPEHFIMYRPHSIVSGDFYMVTSYGTKKVCIVGDCTGHGVSGGFLSMLGMSFFRQIVSYTQKPSEILHQMREHIIENLNQGDGINTKNQDGMDASVFVIDSITNVLEYAGANSRLVIVHDGKLLELKGDKMPVSTHFAHKDELYTNSSFNLSTGDMVYSFSDGYIDQFGGPDYKKFKMSRFRDLLASIASLPIHKQSEIINETFDEYKGKHPQTDDVVVLGVRV